MSWLKDNKMFIFLIYVNIVFTLTLVKICYKIEKFDYLYASIFIIIGFILNWVLHSSLKRKSFKIIFFIVMLSAGAIYYYLNSKYVIKLIDEQIVNNFLYINSLVSEAKPTNFIAFKPLLVITLPLLILIIIFLTSKGLSNSILIVNFIIITTLWYLGYTEEIKKYLFYYILVSLITYCINTFKKNIKKLNKKGVKVSIDSRKIFVYTIILSVLIAEITNYMPQDFKGKYTSDIKSKFINKYMQNGESEENKARKLKYDLSYSGYDKNSKKLGGPITINKLVAFRVKSDGIYYLKGAVKDKYDGFSWSQSEIKYNMQSEKDKSMFQDQFSITLMNTSKSITIYPEELNSTSLFIPNYTYNAAIEKGNVYYDDIPTFITGDAIHKPYNISFYDLNIEGVNIANKGISENKKEVGTIYYSDTYKRYLQVPNNLSPRIYDLVYSLTKDKNYNFEKVQAIKDYLNSSFKYTLKVSNVPDEQEFLDYFLFTEKKGYCTYFATAETIMCRIAGIPARYVEGFAMTSGKDKNGLYEVKNENAHAWTEVLYMQSPTIGLWYTVDAVPNAVELIHKEEEASNVTSNNDTPNKGSGISLPSKKSKENFGDNETSYFKQSIPTSILYSIYIGTVIIIVNLLLMFLVLIKKESLLLKSSIIPLYKYSLERLETMGIKQPYYMSEMEFINSIEEELSVKVKEACVLAYSEYFGEKEPQKFNKKQYYRFIEDHIKKRENKFLYFIKKYYFIYKVSLIKVKIMVLYRKIRSLI